jgi:hypothetical protein
MASTDADLIEKIKTIVVEHYQADSSPLLLSDLGTQLRKAELWPSGGIDGKPLRQYIDAAGDRDLVIVRDRNSPAYVAVATAATKEIVEQWIARRVHAASVIPNLDEIPRSVILAFCVEAGRDQSVYLTKSPPFRYEVSKPDYVDPEQSVQVEEKYRRPGLKISNLSELSATDRLDLQTRIASWSRDKNIPIETFYKPVPKKGANALERLLAAQPSGIAEKIVIPGDIALLLSRSE